MGFLDKVTKAVNDTVDGVSKAVTDATSSTSTPGSPAPSSSPLRGDDDRGQGPLDQLVQATPDDWYFNSLEPQHWIPAPLLGAFVAQTGGPTGLEFPAAQVFSRDDAVVARFASLDSSVTVDFVSYTEEFLASVGDLTALFEMVAGDLHDASGIGNPAYDGYEQGSTGAGHARAVAALGDAAFAVDIYAPATVSPMPTAIALLDAAIRLDDPRFS